MVPAYIELFFNIQPFAGGFFVLCAIVRDESGEIYCYIFVDNSTQKD